ncbi:hypothetical protein [Solimonas flava]|uniref:hypothetical protein n=1 Tax=Solimonas flava TaxID=415849 RepID=UPI00041182F4|nr:hypothetical protein [Solimonas flava]
MSLVDLAALGFTAAGVRLPGGGDDSSRLERGLAALLLHAAALVLWNAAGDPATAFGHWSLAGVALLALRGLGHAAQRLPLPPLRRHAPTAMATIMLGLLWLHAAPR